MNACPTTLESTIGPDSALREVLARYPGAQRALFRRYHIGGCSSCAFSPDETVAQLCARSGNLDVAEVLAHLEASHEEDRRLFVTPADLAAQLRQEPRPRLVDIRSREEFDAARLEGAVLLSQPVMQEILGHWPRSEPVVMYDHQGRQVLDAVAYLLGHGFTHVRGLRGGLDAWSQEVDPRVPRYRLE